MSRRPLSRAVWVHRARALVWLVIGVAAFPLGLASSVELVWMASVYANVFTDWGASEAADDTAVLSRLDEVEQIGRRIEANQAAIMKALKIEG